MNSNDSNHDGTTSQANGLPASQRWGRLRRRDVLRSVGGLGLSAAVSPFVPVLEAEAQAAPKKRFVFMYTPNGVFDVDRFVPTGSGRNFTLSEMLQPLEPFRDHIVPMSGVQMAVTRSNTAEIGGHGGCPKMLLTGRGSTRNNGARGISIDQHIARAIGTQTPFPSLELAVTGTNRTGRTVFYSEEGRSIPAERDPYDAFEQIFGGNESEAVRQERLATRRSVIDFVRDELRDVERRAAVQDRYKVDAHLGIIGDIERRLLAQAELNCGGPDVGNRININSSDNIPEVGKLQADLLVSSLACDLTRVASLQWGYTVWGATLRFLGHTSNHHSYTHQRGGSQRIEEATQWFAGQLAYLMEQLQAIPEGNGTLLDNTVILWMSEFGAGGRHNPRPLPVVMAGGGAMLETGRFLQFDNIPHNDVLVSIAQLMGLTDTTFGEEEFCNGPLSELV